MLQGKTFQRKMLHEILQLKLTYLLTNLQCTTHTKKSKKIRNYFMVREFCEQENG